MQHRRRVFGMELRTDIPLLFRYLDNLHQICCGVDTYTLHTSSLVLLLIFIIELVAMTMALFNHRPTPLPLSYREGSRNSWLHISLIHFATFYQLAVVGSEPHRPTHLRYRLLLLHEVNHVYPVITPLLFREGLGGGSHFCTIRIFVAEDVTGKLDDHHLHTQTNAEGGDVVSTSVFRSYNFSFYATLSEARTDNKPRHAT